MTNHVHICADIGSTHLGNKELAFSGVVTAKKIGCDSVKFQLFPDIPKYTDCGNISLPKQWVPELIAYGKEVGIPVTFSYFEDEDIELSKTLDVAYHKIAYSKIDQWWKLDYNAPLVVSCDFMNDHRLVDSRVTKLYCLPVYPVPYQVSFEGVFPRFHGFSDHTIGFKQTLNAVTAGAKWIEKHISLTDDIASCPDARFALQPNQFESMIKQIRQLEKYVRLVEFEVEK